MLTATVCISNIDYESTYEHIFPYLKNKLQKITPNNAILKLFQQLDDAALPVLLGILFHLPDDTKNELLVRSLNVYAPTLLIKTNEVLKADDEWGRFFSIGTLSVTYDSVIMLKIGQIDVDYSSLMDKEQVNDVLKGKLGRFSGFAEIVKSAANAAITYAPNITEKKGVERFWNEDNKSKLQDILKKVLFDYGIRATFSNIQIAQDTTEQVDAIDNEQSSIWNDKIENDIVVALSGFLCDLISNSAG